MRFGIIFRSCCLPVLACLLTSCIAGLQQNPYEHNFRVPGRPVDEYVPAEPGTVPRLEVVTDWDRLRALQEEGGYVVLGTSAFTQTWVPRRYALDFASRLGASLVLVFHHNKKDKEKPDPYASRFVKAVYHRPSVFGPVMPPDNYTWTTPIFPEIPRPGGNAGVVRFQYACFLAKRRHAAPFGVYFIRPEDIPGSRDTRVRVALVVPRSPAARQGIKPGDPVKRINGTLVTSFSDVLPYVTNRRKIRTLEVYHE